MLAKSLLSASLKQRKSFSCLKNGISEHSNRSFFTNDNQAKRHQERKLLRVPIEHIYGVVSDVAQYKQFVPWCTNSTIIEQKDGFLRAELAVGFKYLNEKYISEVTLDQPNSVVAISNQAGMFEFLRSQWKFAPASDPKNTWVTFQIEFKFTSSLYNEISELFMQEVVKQMVKAFETRCMKIPFKKTQ